MEIHEIHNALQVLYFLTENIRTPKVFVFSYIDRFRISTMCLLRYCIKYVRSGFEVYQRILIDIPELPDIARGASRQRSPFLLVNIFLSTFNI